uniref:5'-3' exonuclease domain-containing protein n=1 Tax=viral metagenome TaxID=1070528 RepID=A0A6C0D9K9_9ZZZZ
MISLINSIEYEKPNTFILIDGSYFCFYRYHSIMRWWKNAYPENELIDPFLNETFVEKFKKTFVDNVKNIIKNLNINNDEKPFMIVGKDCKRESIWRNEIFDKYKGTRKTDDKFMGGPFFKMVYEDKLFQQGGVRYILKHPKLEADDCLAISGKYILEKYPNSKIYIITSDKDYLQLANPRLRIFNLSYKEISEKTLGGSAEVDLFCKIVMGDISDNIPSVLNKCGPKTALKCYNNKEYFDERMKKENAYDKFELNRKIIDFNYIPQHLIDEFMNTDSDCFA